MRQQYIGFKLDNSEYSLPILKVREIINTPAITKLPQSPYYVKGIINLRGSITPVLELKTLLGTSGGESEGGKVIVLTTGRFTFGILVDSITSVINIDDSIIEAPGEFLPDNVGRVQGVARLEDRLVILLETDKLVDMQALGLMGGDAFSAAEIAPVGMGTDSYETRSIGHDVEAVPLGGADAQPKAGLVVARDALTMQYGDDEHKNNFIKSVVDLLETLNQHDYEKADILIVQMMKNTGQEASLYKEVGKVTRKLHDTLSEFKNFVDPRLRGLADNEIPTAVDNLQFVINKTEDSANQTMEIVEKYISKMPEVSAHISKLKGPQASTEYLRGCMQGLHEDLNKILVAQETQDITGQTIKKVIDLVNTIEAELVGLIATFGVKLDEIGADRPAESQRLTQDDIDKMLKEFGF